MDTPEDVLRAASTIAVVGASRAPDKAAHDVPAQLQAAGFRIVPINPFATELLGERVYRNLAAIPFAIDLVLVFRPSREAEAIARQAVAIGAKALWLQLGLHSDAARQIATAAGLAYVEDSCSAVVRSLARITKV